MPSAISGPEKPGQQTRPLAQIEDADAYMFFEETSFKTLHLKEDAQGKKTLLIAIDGSAVRNYGDPLTQERLNALIDVMYTTAEESGLRPYLPDAYGLEPDPAQPPRMLCEYVEGETVGTTDNEVSQLNDAVRRMLPLIQKHGFCLDAHRQNIRTTPEGHVKIFDLFPVISETPSALTAGETQDPYEFLLLRLDGILSPKSIRAIVRNAKFDARRKEYWSIKAFQSHIRERKLAPIDTKPFDPEKLKPLAQSIVDLLRTCPNVSEAGIFGSMARDVPRVGDIDMFAVVTPEAFLEYVACIRETAKEKKSTYFVSYVPKEKVGNIIGLRKRDHQRIARKQKVTLDTVERIVETHIILLPNSVTDPKVREEMTWLIQHQPDPTFFTNILQDAQTTMRTTAQKNSRLESNMPQEWADFIYQTGRSEQKRREQLFSEVDEEMKRKKLTDPAEADEVRLRGRGDQENVATTESILVAPEHPIDLNTGDPVTVITGSFKGQSGVFQNMNPKTKKANVRFSILGRTQVVAMNITDLRKA